MDKGEGKPKTPFPKDNKIEDEDENENGDEEKTDTDRPTARKEYKGTHCDYIDLVDVGYRENSSCAVGGKFLFKPTKTVRRQFLMTTETNIAIFLEKGKKVTDCNGTFNDVTTQVKCKPVTGVLDMKIIRQTGGATCSGSVPCPDINQLQAGGATAAPAAAAPPPGSGSTITCSCPDSFLCSMRVESDGNSHQITCNNMGPTTITCGSTLVGRWMGSLFQKDKFIHPLCATAAYLNILTEYEWRCGDRTIAPPASGCCEEDCTTTVPPITTQGPGRVRQRGFFDNFNK